MTDTMQSTVYGTPEEQIVMDVLFARTPTIEDDRPDVLLRDLRLADLVAWCESQEAMPWHDRTWDQSWWENCSAGHVVRMAGARTEEMSSGMIARRAQALLDLDDEQAKRLFYADADAAQIRRICEHIAGHRLP